MTSYASVLFGDMLQGTLERARPARSKRFGAVKLGWGINIIIRLVQYW